MFELYAETMMLTHATTSSAPENIAALLFQLDVCLGASNSMYSERMT